MGTTAKVSNTVTYAVVSCHHIPRHSDNLKHGVPGPPSDNVIMLAQYVSTRTLHIYHLNQKV